MNIRATVERTVTCEDCGATEVVQMPDIRKRAVYAPDLDSWADDTHYVALTEECLERLEAM